MRAAPIGYASKLNESDCADTVPGCPGSIQTIQMKLAFVACTALRFLLASFNHSEYERLKSLTGISMIEFFSEKESPSFTQALEDVAANEYRPSSERVVAEAILGNTESSLNHYARLYPYEKDEVATLLVRSGAVVPLVLAGTVLTDPDVVFDTYHYIPFGKEPYCSLLELNMIFRKNVIAHFIDRFLGSSDDIDVFKSRWRNLLASNHSYLSIRLNQALNQCSDELIANSIWKIMREEIEELSDLPKNIFSLNHEDRKIFSKTLTRFKITYPNLHHIVRFVEDVWNGEIIHSNSP